jgi:glycosyltransferase involved in cell wall biosynthesis
MESKLILSICIPTYNRASFLAKNLQSVCSQLGLENSSVEILVSDNASQDNTKDVVDSFIRQGYAIRYFRNEINKGFDFNFKNCINNASGKYIWLFGDDDFLLPNTLGLFIKLLRENDFGSIYVNSKPFLKEEQVEFDSFSELVYETYLDSLEYYEKINYFTTFITGNIFNRYAVDDSMLLPLDNTNLIQLNWTIPAIFSGRANLFVKTAIVAARTDNTGGYKLITTFAKNYNIILKMLVDRGYNKEIISITNKNLLKSFFPQFIYKILYDKNSFEKENGFSILLSSFWRYSEFWKNISPIYAKFLVKKAIRHKSV